MDRGGFRGQKGVYPNPFAKNYIVYIFTSIYYVLNPIDKAQMHGLVVQGFKSFVRSLA